jgi:hypothetical protein
MSFAPYLMAAGTVVQGIQKQNASDFNSKVMQQESNLSINQANAQEGQVRRDSRMALGKQEAAFGAAGVGYGGSSETSLDQSAVNQEYDALKTRYKGASTAYGYGVQSGIDKSEGNTEMTQSGLLAGSQLLKGMGPNYSFAPSGLGSGN